MVKNLVPALPDEKIEIASQKRRICPLGSERNPRRLSAYMTHTPPCRMLTVVLHIIILFELRIMPTQQGCSYSALFLRLLLLTAAD